MRQIWKRRSQHRPKPAIHARDIVPEVLGLTALMKSKKRRDKDRLSNAVGQLRQPLSKKDDKKKFVFDGELAVSMRSYSCNIIY